MEIQDVLEFASPKGLFYLQDFIEQDVGTTILKFLDQNNKWKPLSGSPNSRKVQHYGFLYDYKSYNIRVPTDPIPEELATLVENLDHACTSLNLIKDLPYFNQCIINNYEPGQGISKHIDVKSYGDVIGCYTFGGGATMKFTNPAGRAENLYTEPNSLYIMSGDARYKWTHEMLANKTDVFNGMSVARKRRVSITFRHVP